VVFGVTYRGRILPDAIDEDVAARIIIVVEIVMRVLDFVVENADMDAAAVIVVPAVVTLISMPRVPPNWPLLRKCH
jgi:hypothetical protein